MSLHLISHALCPYVQRAVIALREKGVEFERTDVNLAAKPDWFLKLSPLGRTPVLVADDTPIFESAVILEYLEETQPHPLHPADAVARARHRGWIEFASAVLNDIAALYTAADAEGYEVKRAALAEKLGRVELELGDGPYFAGAAFCLVDAAFGPVFRYFDTFEETVGLRLFHALPRTREWRSALSERPSVMQAVAADYSDRLRIFLRERNSHVSRIAA